MADNKKYYYMRLKENFFDTNEMKVLESMQDGYKYSNILLKLYLMSLQSDGKLMLNERIPYNSQMIATITRHSVGDVEKALVLFKDLGLIEILDSGAIYMLDIQKYIGKSSTEADRHREYQRKISCSEEICEKSNRKSTPEIEIELELEKDIEIDIDTDKKKKKKSAKADLNGMIDSFTGNEELKEALKAFLDMRKSIKKPIQTEYAFKLALNKLKQLSDRDSIRIEIVNQSVEHNWQTFYTLQNSYRTNDVEMPDYMKKQEKGDIVSTPVSDEALAKALELQRQFKGK
jgi:predicted phage replisome organizer